jgi:hypothetical protein
MPDYTIWQFQTSQLRGQASNRGVAARDDTGKVAGSVTAADAHEALTRFLSEGGVEGRRIELTVARDPRGQDEASVEIAYQLFIARRAKPLLLAEEPVAQELEGEDDEASSVLP